MPASCPWDKKKNKPQVVGGVLRWSPLGFESPRSGNIRPSAQKNKHSWWYHQLSPTFWCLINLNPAKMFCCFNHQQHQHSQVPCWFWAGSTAVDITSNARALSLTAPFLWMVGKTIPSHGGFMAARVSHINLDTYCHAAHGLCRIVNQETKPMAFKTNMLHEFTRYYDSYNM